MDRRSTQVQRTISKLFTSPWIIFLVALSLRMVGAADVIHNRDRFLMNEPSHIAAHLARGEGFSTPYDNVPIAPTAQQPPLYPVLLAFVFKLFGVYSHASLIVILGMNAVIGAVVSLLMCRVGERYLSLKVGAIAAWAWAIWPNLIAGDLFIYNYPASTAVVLGSLLVLPAIPDGKRWWILLGVGGGMAALLNPMLLLLYVAGLPWLIERPKRALLSVAVTVLVMSGWWIRNYFQLGHFYPTVRDDFGIVLYIGNHPGMEKNPQHCVSTLCEDTASYADADYPMIEPRLYAALGEAAFMAKKQHDALAYIRSQPQKFIWRTAKRAASFWLLPHIGFNLMLVILAWIGVFRTPAAFRWFTLVMFIVFPIVFYITQILWIVGYRHPLQPLILLSAAAMTMRNRAPQPTAAPTRDRTPVAV